MTRPLLGDIRGLEMWLRVMRLWILKLCGVVVAVGGGVVEVVGDVVAVEVRMGVRMRLSVMMRVACSTWGSWRRDGSLSSVVLKVV